MNTRIVVGILIAILVIPLALIMGQLAATDPVTVGIIFVVVTGALTLYGLGEHMWVLIPGSLLMKGKLAFLPGNPDPWQIATLIVAPLMCLGFVTRTRRLEFKWTWIEWAVLLQVVAIGQSYLRNPTGLSVLGGGIVGGKHYIDYGVAFLAFTMLASVKTTPTILKRAIILMIVIGIADASLGVLTSVFPEAGFKLMRIYSVGNMLSMLKSLDQGIDFSLSRFAVLSGLGSIGMLICCSFWRPVASIDPRKPYRFLILVISMVSILLSGFRGLLASSVVRFGLGSWIRKKPMDVLIVGVVGVLFLVVIIGAVDLRKLPFGIQRTLSFLPVNVSPQARESAERSNEFRFEMWEAVLTQDKYIRNKMLGDGFGYSAIEQALMEDSIFNRGGHGGDLESFIAKGSYHGFHVETIRFTGVFGLILATFALFVFSVRAWRVTQKYKDSSAWGAVIFLCLPMIYAPYWYWLVYGSYKVDFVLLIVSAGMLRIAEQVWNGEQGTIEEEVLNQTEIG